MNNKKEYYRVVIKDFNNINPMNILELFGSKIKDIICDIYAVEDDSKYDLKCISELTYDDVAKVYRPFYFKDDIYVYRSVTEVMNNVYNNKSMLLHVENNTTDENFVLEITSFDFKYMSIIVYNSDNKGEKKEELYHYELQYGPSHMRNRLLCSEDIYDIDYMVIYVLTLINDVVESNKNKLEYNGEYKEMSKDDLRDMIIKHKEIIDTTDNSVYSVFLYENKEEPSSVCYDRKYLIVPHNYLSKNAGKIIDFDELYKNGIMINIHPTRDDILKLENFRPIDLKDLDMTYGLKGDRPYVKIIEHKKIKKVEVDYTLINERMRKKFMNSVNNICKSIELEEYYGLLTNKIRLYKDYIIDTLLLKEEALYNTIYNRRYNISTSISYKVDKNEIMITASKIVYDDMIFLIVKWYKGVYNVDLYVNSLKLAYYDEKDNMIIDGEVENKLLSERIKLYIDIIHQTFDILNYEYNFYETELVKNMEKSLETIDKILKEDNLLSEKLRVELTKMGEKYGY